MRFAFVLRTLGRGYKMNFLVLRTLGCADLVLRFSCLAANFSAARSVEILPIATHVPSPGMQSFDNGQSLPFPDFAAVFVQTLSPTFSHAAEHDENVPSQSTSCGSLVVVGSQIVG